MALTAEKWFQPAIPLVDENGQKIKLRLRRMTFEREIDSLPADLKELHNLMVTQRSDRNESMYMMVAAWCKLKRYHQYWKSFHFQSEQEYLIYYDLPEGATLGQWEVIVKLFDKSTFTLLGHNILSYMLRYIASYQSDSDERKRDYQAIFDNYCKVNEAFDKTTFYSTIRHYVDGKYVKPQEQQGGTTRETRRKGGGRKKEEPLRPGQRKRRVTREATDGQQYGPHVERDFDWKTEQCSACKVKIALIEDLILQLELCEELIRKRFSEKEVPVRPPSISDLHL